MLNEEIPFPAPRRKLQAALRHSLTILLATTVLGVVSAHAVDGIWQGPGTDWVDGTNWSSNPDVPNGTATFDNNAAPTSLNNGGFVAIGTVQFLAGAPSYTIGVDNAFLVTGTGFINNSGNPQTFNVSDNLIFQNGSSAGGVNINNAGFTFFQNTSTAGTAVIVNGGVLQFNDTSTAAGATITNNAVMDFFDGTSAGSSSITNSNTGTLSFNNTAATAANATISNDGVAQFNDTSTAANAVITTNSGGTTSFTGASTGGNARFITNAGGTVDISGLGAAGMTAGSIEGAGDYVLGSKTLTAGGNNASTTVDGVISGNGGGIAKVGTGTMTLTGTNTYTGYRRHHDLGRNAGAVGNGQHRGFQRRHGKFDVRYFRIGDSLQPDPDARRQRWRRRAARQQRIGHC
jgi:hypothetical protein